MSTYRISCALCGATIRKDDNTTEPTWAHKYKAGMFS